MKLSITKKSKISVTKVHIKSCLIMQVWFQSVTKINIFKVTFMYMIILRREALNHVRFRLSSKQE